MHGFNLWVWYKAVQARSRLGDNAEAVGLRLGTASVSITSTNETSVVDKDVL